MSSNSININQKLLFGGSKNDDKFTHYIFEIILFFNNNLEPIRIEETTTDKYINLFSYKNKINFNEIKFYELNIKIISFTINNYSIKNKFINSDNYTYKDDIIYLEITKNVENFANCCVYINNDKSRLFFTPPNY
jgi:hypothetical protein